MLALIDWANKPVVVHSGTLLMVKTMAEYGVKVSESTLKRWRKKHGIAKYNKKT